MILLIAALVATPSLLFPHRVARDGLHAQVLTGLGGGPNQEGLFVASELGGTLKNGVTMAALHVLLQNRSMFAPNRGPDAIFGSLFELKIPLHFAELEVKLGAGFSAVLDQLRPSIIPGVMLAHGLDLHVPIFERHGPTLGITFLHTLVPAHYFTVAVAAGYTFF